MTWMKTAGEKKEKKVQTQDLYSVSRGMIGYFILLFFASTELSHWDFSHGKFAALHSCNNLATQPMVHAGCFSVSIIHQTLTWTTGSLKCARLLMHVNAHNPIKSNLYTFFFFFFTLT